MSFKKNEKARTTAHLQAHHRPCDPVKALQQPALKNRPAHMLARISYCTTQCHSCSALHATLRNVICKQTSYA